MDVLAAELDIDPVELRRRNLLRPEDFAHQSPCGPLYDATDHATDLAAHHDDGELVEIVTTVGHYTMLAMIANSAGVPPEPWWATLGEAP